VNTVKIQSSTSTVVAAEAETTYIVGKNVTIDTMSDTGIDMSGDAKYRTLHVDGTVNATHEGILIGEQPAPFGGVKLFVGETGTVSGDTHGIYLYGQGHLINNAGEISGGSKGITTDGTNRIVNSGLIEGSNTAIDMYGGTGEGVNLIVNTGTISGHNAIYASTLEYDKVVNSGKIVGDVKLGGRDDMFVFKAGKVDGTVYGDEGDDRYVVNKAGLTISEDFGEGTDDIYSSVTITMPANVERLFLTGKGDIDATGGTGGNWIYGNSGANRIDAGGGFDVVDGGKGNDVLTGGSSSDDFHFARGSGRDIVTDFEAGLDEIELGDLKGAKDFADMLANHLSEKGDDLVITYGHDVVVLKGMAGATLQAGDFDFG
jgi:Ca2+-binding RTX toxin-like protein